MNYKNYIDKKENIVLLSILFAGLLSLFGKKNFFLITWILNILILSNVRRIKFKNISISFFRITLYFIHYFLFFILFIKNDKFVTLNAHTYILLIIFVFFGIVHVFRYKNLFKIIFKSGYINSLPKKEEVRYFLDFYSQFGAAICEELYFRYCIISMFHSYGIFSVFISTLYFFLSHYILPWSYSFSKKDFINQIIYGGLMGIIFFYTGSILLCISLHLLFNVHTILLPLFSYYYFYIKKNNDNEFNDEFRDIEL